VFIKLLLTIIRNMLPRFRFLLPRLRLLLLPMTPMTSLLMDYFFRDVPTIFRLLLPFLWLLLLLVNKILPILILVLTILRHPVDFFKPLIPCHVLSQYQVELFNTATQLSRL